MLFVAELEGGRVVASQCFNYCWRIGLLGGPL